MNIMNRIFSFLKSQAVLCISGIACIISCFFVTPSKDYIGYIDFNTLILLFCLMLAVGALKASGAFVMISNRLLSGNASVFKISTALVGVCFFTSMIITNDVALLTFVPLTLILLDKTGYEKTLAMVVILETVAANLGSMLTPIGNPQNIYLYEYYDMSALFFFKAILPIGVLSLVLIYLALALIPKKDDILPTDEMDSDSELIKPKLIVAIIMIAACLLSVFGILPHKVCIVICYFLALFFVSSSIKSVDWALLVTFVFFFIFAGNIAKIEAVSEFLENAIKSRELFVSFLASQFISNVPAACLLSGFTDNGAALLQGVNIGGLGTPVASLASLISFKIYSKAKTASPKSYLCKFLGVNFGLAIVLLVFTVIFI